MSIRWAEAIVSRVISCRDGVQELAVRMITGGEDALAILYTDEHDPAAPGDRVLVNATAIELGLGTGGRHFVHAVLTDRPIMRKKKAAHPGHMMKLRYTSLQRAVWAAEEETHPHRKALSGERKLEGMPVLIGELHSMLPVALCWLRMRAAEGAFSYDRVLPVYVMTDGGALPLAFSRHVRELRRHGWLAGTITYGHAYGGETETMNKFTALLAARHVYRSRLCIAAMGPGIAGTGSKFGHTGMETGEIAHAVHALGGVPILIPRISFADRRERHRGISHHVFGVLETMLAPVRIPLPLNVPADQKAHMERQIAHSAAAESTNAFQWLDAGVNAERVRSALSLYPGEPVTTMGRSAEDDPAFFTGVCAAAEAAIAHLGF